MVENKFKEKIFDFYLEHPILFEVFYFILLIIVSVTVSLIVASIVISRAEKTSVLNVLTHILL